MVRDASDTRERILTTAQRLFAREGIYQVPLKRIVERAGQRNASALHYHFGDRDGLLHEIIVRHDDRIQRERHQMLTQLERDGRTDDLRALVLVFVVPFSHELDTPDGREYLQIVSQLSMLFDFWDVELPTGLTELQRMFRSMDQCLPHLARRVAPRADHDAPRPGHRGAGDAGAAARRSAVAPAALAHDDFVANLVDMGVGALSAPSTAGAIS